MSKAKKPATYTYRNISDYKQSVPYVGEVEPGETVEVETPFDNPNFELIENGKSGKEK